ncbi:MAG: hypothetical protein ACI4U9_03325 [Clostridia bacterium]
MEIIELEKAIEIATEYLFRAKDTENVADLSVEMARQIRDNQYDIDNEEDMWQNDEVTQEQLKMIRYMVYHDYERLTKGDANRIIRILKQTRGE